MSISYNASIPSDGLLLCFDTFNAKSYDGRENLLTYSEQLDNAAWGKVESTVTTNAYSAPDGTMSGDLWIESATTNAYHYFNQAITKPASSYAYTFSMYVKNAGRRVGLRLAYGGNGAVSTFDPSTGTITTGAGTYGTGFSNASSIITPIVNGWYRISLTVTSDAATGLTAEVYMHNGTSAVYTGVGGTTGVAVWGMQLESAASVGTYLGTTTPAVSRTNTMYDLGPYKNNASMSNMVWKNSPPTLTYEGQSRYGYGAITPSLLNQPYTGKTIITAIRIDPTMAVGYHGIFGSGSAVGGRNFNFYVYQGASDRQLHWSARNSVGGTNGYMSNAFAINSNWMIAAATLTDTTMIFYINGVAVGTNRTTGLLGQFGLNTDENIGRADNYFVGDIAYLSLYTRALSATEMNQAYNALRGRFGI